MWIGKDCQHEYTLGVDKKAQQRTDLVAETTLEVMLSALTSLDVNVARVVGQLKEA